MAAFRHPQVHWITLQYYDQQTPCYLMTCTVCGQQVYAFNDAQVTGFVQAHAEHRSAAPSHYGLGDVVARATKAVGIAPCTPCEQRRRMLNGMLPKVMRRR
jgi:hypothetical protein